MRPEAPSQTAPKKGPATAAKSSDVDLMRESESAVVVPRAVAPQRTAAQEAHIERLEWVFAIKHTFNLHHTVFSFSFLFKTIHPGYVRIHASIEVSKPAQGFALMLLTIKLCKRR